MSVEGGDPLALASLTDQGNYKVSQVMPAQPAMPASEADGDAQNAKTVDDSKGDEGSDADAPGCFIRFIAYHPYWMLFISFFIALVMGVIPFLMGMNAFASQEGGRFDAYDDYSSRQFYAQIELQKPLGLSSCPKVTDRLPGQSVLALSPSDPRITVYHKDLNRENLLTHDKLVQIADFEQSMLDLGEDMDAEDKFTNFCLMSSEECKHKSIVDPFRLPNGKIQSDSQIKQTIKDLRADKGNVNPSFDKNFYETGESVFAASFFDLGRPLTKIDERYCDPNFEKDDQDDKWVDFLTTHYSSFFKDGKNEVTEVGFLANNLIELDFGALIAKDVTLVMLSIALVMIVMIIHTKSLFLATMGVFHIFLSFPAAAFIYRLIFMFEIYPGINLMALFIIYGIGADDVFVMVDAWRQSDHQPLGGSLARKVQWAWKRAASAMFITSFTTFMAFVATALSPVPTIQTFGIFSAAVVLCNYVLVITWYPAVLVVWHIMGWDKNGWSFCCNAEKLNYKQSDSTRTPSHNTVHAKSMEMNALASPSVGGDVRIHKEEDEEEIAPPAAPPTPPQAQEEESMLTGHLTAEEELGDISRYGPVEQFYHSKLFPCVVKTRWAILLLSLLMMIAGIIGTSQLSTSAVNQIPIPIEINSGRAINWLVKEFQAGGSESSSAVWVIFGLRAPYLDISGVDPNQIDEPGSLLYNDDFDVSDPDMQQFVFDVCKDAAKDVTEDNDEGDCIFRQFRTWSNGRSGFPVPAKDFVDEMDAFLSAFPSERKWIDYASIQNGDKPTWVMLEFPSGASLEDNNQRNEKNAVWLQFAEDANERLGDNENLDNNIGIFVAGQSFIEERTVVLLAASTFSGVMLSLVIAFVALVMATDNIAIASLAIINIGGVVLCTIALIVSFGWSLDVIESICITILVGVSVDFIVHFAHAYSESESRKRSDKARVAWTHLGISVVFGGTTTLLATLPLFFTVFEFFSKFGTFLFCAILLALYFSHFPFLVMLTMVGPESKQYKPTFWFGKLRKKWEERKANKADQA